MCLDNADRIVELIKFLLSIDDEKELKIHPKGMIDNNGEYIEF